MVWGLFPIDPIPGENKYYIFSKGTYKVGRKGCDIIINKDKGVSRIHAEIIVDEMICMDNLHKRTSKASSKVRIRDFSKYGTFINKDTDSKEKVHECPDKETLLKDGDLVSFGTGNAIYRFGFVSLVFFFLSSKPSEMNQLKEKTSLIGATVTRTLTLKCTHVVTDDSNSINDEIIDAIVAKKPIINFSWIELIAGQTICTEMPSSFLHTPTLTFEGVYIKVTDPQSREHCLKGYTFLLDSIHKYRFKEKLQLLLNAGGGKPVGAETLEPDSQSLGEKLVCVMPADSISSSECFHNFNSLPRVKEMELISAVLSGHLDPSIMASVPVLVASSCSTDETVVAESDVEMETATSIRVSEAVEDAEDKFQRKISIESEMTEKDCRVENLVHVTESLECENEGNTAEAKAIEDEGQGPSQAIAKLDSSYLTAVKTDCVNLNSSRDIDGSTLERKDRGHASDSENVDVIYSQDLIVRDLNLPIHTHSAKNEAVINFKRFRKISTPSGNSFNSLIPFAKQPYEGFDYGNDVAESMKEEKKRKQMEAIADDLFNYEKRKRQTSGSLHRFLARG